MWQASTVRTASEVTIRHSTDKTLHGFTNDGEVLGHRVRHTTPSGPPRERSFRFWQDRPVYSRARC